MRWGESKMGKTVSPPRYHSTVFTLESGIAVVTVRDTAGNRRTLQRKRGAPHASLSSSGMNTGAHAHCVGVHFKFHGTGNWQ